MGSSVRVLRCKTGITPVCGSNYVENPVLLSLCLPMPSVCLCLFPVTLSHTDRCSTCSHMAKPTGTIHRHNSLAKSSIGTIHWQNHPLAQSTGTIHWHNPPLAQPTGTIHWQNPPLAQSTGTASVCCVDRLTTENLGPLTLELLCECRTPPSLAL